MARNRSDNIERITRCAWITRPSTKNSTSLNSSSLQNPPRERLNSDMELGCITSTSGGGSVSKIKKSFKFNILDNKINIGYGGVQKKAYRYAVKKNFDYVIMLHGDGQYTPKKLPKFIYELKNSDYDAVFGTRMWSWYSAIKGGMPIYKYFGNVFLTAVQNLILKTRFSEFHSGYRSYKINTLKKINLQKLSNDFHFDTEIIIEFIFKKFKILEVPIPTIYKDQISHLKSIPYGLNVLFSTLTHKKS